VISSIFRVTLVSRGAVLAGVSVLLALVAAVALTNGLMSDEVANPIVEEPKIRNVTIGVIPGMPSSLPSYTFLTRLAEDDINKYCVDEGLAYRFRFNISEPVEQSPDALRYTKKFLSSGVKVILGFEWSSHLCSGARIFGYNKTMVLMSPSASSSTYSIVNDTLYRLCPTDFEPLEVTLKAMSYRGVKAVVAFSVYSNTEYNFNALIKRQLALLGIEHYASVTSPALTQDFPILDVERLLDRADSAVAEAIQKYGANSTAVLFLPGDVDPAFSWSTDDPNPSIREVVEAAAKRPSLSSVTWYGLEVSARQKAYEEMPEGVAAKLKMISSVESFTPTPIYDRVNALWLASKEAPPNAASLNTYTANIYDGLWVLSLSVIEANSTEPLPLMSVIPGVASGYVGATGRCTLDDAGDRLGADFNFYYYAVVDGVTKSVKLGSYGWEADQFTWSDAER
jgi:ABC-type branched-subunit amino acid transport system substrate-binding protein